MWNRELIEKHKKAAELLVQVKDSALDFIRHHDNASEKEASDFMLAEFKKLGLKRDKDPPIAAFSVNTDRPHYFPGENSKNIKDNTLILIDLWAKLRNKRAPFADITWMAYKGSKVPEEIMKVFQIITSARDKGVSFIQDKLKEKIIPSGNEIDNVVRNFIHESGFEGKFLHSTGHSLGFSSCHGRNRHIKHSNKRPLLKNLGYTIEPGIYLKDKFGIRSEIDFYIDDNFNLIITTPVQKEMTLI